MKKPSGWFLEYKRCQGLATEAELIIMRVRVLELEKEAIINSFLDGTLSASTAQRFLKETEELYQQMPEVFVIN